MTDKEQPAERRDYFRVLDRIALRVRPIEAASSSPQTPPDLTATYSLLEELHSIDLEHSAILHAINDKSRDLGQYLKAQQRKFELLARHLVLQNTRGLFTLVDVNLSGNGIGFTHATACTLDQLLDIDLVLFPEAWCASLRVKVISCLPQGDMMQIGAEFVDIPDEQRDAIIRHCLLIEGHKRRLEREK